MWKITSLEIPQVPALSMVVMAPHWATMVPDVVPEPVIAPAAIEAVPEAVPEAEVEAEPQQVEEKPKKALSTLSAP